MRAARCAAAYAVHIYTACGALCALAALVAAGRHDLRTAFLWLLLASVIDSSDGALARLVRVREYAPLIDGARLDDIVDYLTFVFVPAVLLLDAGVFPPNWGAPVAAAILLASGFGFARRDAKSADHFFTGFPSYWNIVALYLVAFGWSPVTNAVVVLLFVVLVFLPMGYVYPSKTPVLRWLTVTWCSLWGVQTLAIIWELPDVGRILLWSSLAFPVYYVALSIVLHTRRESDRGAPKGAPY
ncbi:MAG: CDP-diacylglycerol O-phosphatidyltransferase [Luteitalea sp.]|nr:CDP-diacylglycerol O-phosphatidyltransferase [Luteitalea sp.]